MKKSKTKASIENVPELTVSDLGKPAIALIDHGPFKKGDKVYLNDTMCMFRSKGYFKVVPGKKLSKYEAKQLTY